MSKVRYGLNNVHYAKATRNDSTGAYTFGTPVRIPGAVNISIDPQGEITKFYADNTVYWSGNSNSGYSGTLEIALVPDSFKKDCLGYIVDDNGILLEDADAAGEPFALMFEFNGDAKKIKHVLYNCSASRPTVEGGTKEENIEIATESFDFEAAPIPVAISGTTYNLVKANSSDESDATTEAGWYSAVYIPDALQ